MVDHHISPGKNGHWDAEISERYGTEALEGKTFPRFPVLLTAWNILGKPPN